MKARISMMIVLAVLFSLVGAANAETTSWNVVTDFPMDSPNTSAWRFGGINYWDSSYGHEADTVDWLTGGGMDPPIPSGVLRRWHNVAGGAETDGLGTTKNVSGSDVFSDGGNSLYSAGALTNHGGNTSWWGAAVRFTAPSAGEYEVTSNMFGSYVPGVNQMGYVLKNFAFGSPLASGAVTGYILGTHSDFTYSGTVTLAAGDTLDFAIKPVGDIQVTGLQVQIDLVPEPSAIALLLTGLVGLLAYAWRKRK